MARKRTRAPLEPRVVSRRVTTTSEVEQSTPIDWNLPMTDAVTASLSNVDAPGAFAVGFYTAPDALALDVVDVGPIKLPISASLAKRLVDVGTRSPFGLGEQTLVDLAVRNAWEIPRSRVRLDGRRWNPFLRKQLAIVRSGLGLPQDGELSAELDKLVIYEEGQFFVTHQDTEKNDSMLGSLVVVLPSRSSGGTLQVEQHGARLEFPRTSRNARELEWIAFYSDCHHRVQPVEGGHRIALTYNLMFEPGASGLVPGSGTSTDVVTEVVDAVRAFFEAPAPGSDARPQKLVYLLDHEYTPSRLAWGNLKRIDRDRAAALRQAAVELDCEVFLALAENHEIWQCEPRDSRRYGSRGRTHRDDESQVFVPTLDGVIDASATLGHWLDADGESADHEPMKIKAGELRFTVAWDARQPFKSEYEGYMGNWGDTLERWYHRAAVVLWPKESTFHIRAENDPQWAVLELIRLCRRSGEAKRQARERIEVLLGTWNERARRDRTPKLLASTLRLATLVDESEAARKLLAPLVSAPLTVGSVKPLLNLSKRYGASWCEELLEDWHTPQGWMGRKWGDASIEWLQRLVDHGDKVGRRLARRFVAGAWATLKRDFEKHVVYTKRSPFADERVEPLAARLAAHLEACVIADDPAAGRRALALLTPKTSTFSPTRCAELSLGFLDRIDASQRDPWGIDEVSAAIVRALTARLAEAPRAQSDLSIVVPPACTCEDCVELHGFLASQDATRVWPMGQSRRQHIRGVLGAANLPVTHVTRREGNPHKLVLKKTSALWQHDVEARARCKAALASLRT